MDLLCLGRDQDEEDYLAVRAALAAAVTRGELPAARLEEAAARVAEFRAALAAGTLLGAGPGTPGLPGPGTPHVADGADGASGAGAMPANGDGIGLAAARRALRVSGSLGMLTDPLVFEVAPLGNIAVGTVPWGLAPWLPAGSVIQLPAGGEQADRQVAQALARAAGRSVIAVIRDAHRDPGAQAVITRLLAARPDAVVVEMGLPVWRPPARAYLATYGASRTSGQAAAEMLGLTAPEPA